ncbi:MAG: hypothetical protein HYY16_08660 [Planctomycetes bacterium]|nr:hypothetical protein [Planctomycetota bacterium]
MMRLALVLCALQSPQGVSFQEYEQLVREVLEKTVEVQAARKIAQELGVQVALYGGSARDLAFFVRNHDAAWLRQQKQFRLVEMLGTTGSDIDLIATGQAEELGRRLAREHPSMGEFYRWEVKPVSKLDSAVERAQGRNRVDKMLLSVEPFDVPDRVKEWHQEGLQDAYARRVEYVRSADYKKSPEYLAGNHEEFFEVLRWLRFRMGYEGATSSPESEAAARAVMEGALARSGEITGKIHENLFTRRLGQNLKKMFEQSLNLDETDRWVNDLQVKELMERIGFAGGFEIARFTKSYVARVVRTTYAGADGVERPVPLQKLPQEVFTHRTDRGRDTRILLGGFRPSTGGTAGRGVYMAENDLSNREYGEDVVRITLDAATVRYVDITQGEGKAIWEAYVAETGNIPDYDGFARRYGYDVLRYSASPSWYVVKNSGPIVDLNADRPLGRYLRSLARDPWPEKTRKIAEFRAALPSLEDAPIKKGTVELYHEIGAIHRFTELILYEGRLRDVLGGLEGTGDQEEFRREAQRFLEDLSIRKGRVIERVVELIPRMGEVRGDGTKMPAWAIEHLPEVPQRAMLVGRLRAMLAPALERKKGLLGLQWPVDPVAENREAIVRMADLLPYWERLAGASGDAGFQRQSALFRQEFAQAAAYRTRVLQRLVERSATRSGQEQLRALWAVPWLVKAVEKVQSATEPIVREYGWTTSVLPGRGLDYAAFDLLVEWPEAGRQWELYSSLPKDVRRYAVSTAESRLSTRSSAERQRPSPPKALLEAIADGDSLPHMRWSALLGLRRFATEAEMDQLFSRTLRYERHPHVWQALLHQVPETPWRVRVWLHAMDSLPEKDFRALAREMLPDVHTQDVWNAVVRARPDAQKVFQWSDGIAEAKPQEVVPTPREVRMKAGPVPQNRASRFVAREARGALQFGAAFVVKESVVAAETRDWGKIRAAMRELRQPIFWVGLGAFSGASQLTDWGVRLLPSRMGMLTRAWLPLTAGMAAMQGLSGTFSARDLAWSAGTFLVVGTVVDVAMKRLLGPAGWIGGVARLALTLYGAEKLEGWLRRRVESQGVRGGIEGIVP